MTSQTNLPRRQILIAGAAAGAITAFPAIGQGRRSLTVQTLGGAIEKIMRDEIVPAFQKEHNIDVTLVIEDDVTILPKLRAARNSQASPTRISAPPPPAATFPPAWSALLTTKHSILHAPPAPPPPSLLRGAPSPPGPLR